MKYVSFRITLRETLFFCFFLPDVFIRALPVYL